MPSRGKQFVVGILVCALAYLIYKGDWGLKDEFVGTLFAAMGLLAIVMALFARTLGGK